MDLLADDAGGEIEFEPDRLGLSADARAVSYVLDTNVLSALRVPGREPGWRPGQGTFRSVIGTL